MPGTEEVTAVMIGRRHGIELLPEWVHAGLLSPEQVERKVGAIFGERWNRLNDQLAMLYGGIDSKAVTERAADPSGAMGAIQRIMANDVALKNTAMDFSRKPADRKLFQAPFRAGIRLDAYQLLPLAKALDLPRVNLLIADDVHTNDAFLEFVEAVGSQAWVLPRRKGGYIGLIKK